MTPWHRGPMLGFDLESTGVDPTKARIVTAAVAFVGEGSGWNKEWLADAGGEEIPPQATEIHGITTEHAHSAGQPVGHVAIELAAGLANSWAQGVPVVGMNLVYDMTLLDHELARAGQPPLEVGPIIDVLVLDRRADKYRKGKRNLRALCEHYQVRQGEAHTADGDVKSALRVAWMLGEKYRELAATDLDALQVIQAEGHAAWAANYEKYLQRTVPSATVDRTWPIRHAARGVAA